MKKIVAFNGSPRKKGFTSQIMAEVIRGAESQGAQIKVFDLDDDGIKGCQGCFYCRTHAGCARKDALQPAYEEIKNADGIIFSSPIYFYQITGQAKQWLDRMFPMIDGDYKPRFPGKKIVTVYAQANPDKALFNSAIQTTNGIFKMFGWDLVNSLLCYGSNDPAFTVRDSLLKEAYQAGEALAK
jgi:multimeric flavodoxin WrbA